MWARGVAAIGLWLLPSAAFAQAEKRIALLIGNRAYDASVGVLQTPHNDIAVVGEALAKQGFEVLPPIKDARRSAILGGVHPQQTPSGPSCGEARKDQVNGGRGVERQHLRHQQPADDGDAERAPQLRARSTSKQQRQCAEQCCECRH